MESTASALCRRFEQLFDSTDPADRGRRFEKLLRHRLRLEGFQVELNPKIAAPRQTDLFARVGLTDYIIEAKWQTDKIGIADIDNIRIRLQRTPTDVVACIFSMSDYSEQAVDQIVQDRTREILLFNAAEINAIFQQRVHVAELLNKKRDALRINACVLFTDAPSAVTIADPTWPISKQQLFIDGQQVPWFHCRTRDNDVGFLLTDVEINLSGHCVRLALRLDIARPEELAGIFSAVTRHVGLSDEGTFAIHQSGHAWYGFGIAHFLNAIQAWEERYAALKMTNYHHSEELAYFDSCNGRLLALTARQRVGDSVFLHSAELELHLPGIPVNGTGLQQLCAATQNPNAHLEPVLGFEPDRVRREYRQTPVTAVAQIVAIHLDGEQMVTGIVINNPFFGTAPLAPPEGKQKYSPLPYLADTELLVCDLAHWHEPGEIVQNYFFRELSGIWTGHMPVFEIMCEWDEIASGTKPRPNSAEAFERACDRILKEYAEDEDC